MLAAQWFASEWPNAVRILASALIVYAAILVYTRLAGLRSFSKMSAADFAMTVAVGSLFASTISTASPPAADGLIALACLFLGQWLLAYGRRRSDRISRLVDNQPLLLMRGREFLKANMDQANVTRDDLLGKLREANVTQWNQVLAVVFETTGDISVLHSSEDDRQVDAELLENVIGVEASEMEVVQ